MRVLIISFITLFFLSILSPSCDTSKQVGNRVRVAVVPANDTTTVANQTPHTVKKYDSLQIEFGDKLGVAYDSIHNLKLYRYIKDNLGKKCIGNNNKEFTCVSFLPGLYKEVYKINIAENIAAQMKSEQVELYTDTSYLKEGDILFFNYSDKQLDNISHTGFYLCNGFILVASYEQGVMITTLRNSRWIKRFTAAGRIKEQLSGSIAKPN